MNAKGREEEYEKNITFTFFLKSSFRHGNPNLEREVSLQILGARFQNQHQGLRDTTNENTPPGKQLIGAHLPGCD